MSTPQPTKRLLPNATKAMVVQPGNGTRYFIVYGDNFVALPDFGVAATMSPHPADWGYIAEKLSLSKPDAQAVFAALNPHKEAEPEAEQSTGFTIPRPDWVGDDLVAERGEHAGFQMYTTEGNDACAKVVLDLVTRVEAGNLTSRDYAVQWLKNGVSILAVTHPEVHDTEPEWAIVDAINSYCDVAGFRHIDRDHL